MKILLDTNVWRYLLDSGQHDQLYQISYRSRIRIAVSPNILVETLRMSNSTLRNSIVELQTRDCWLRLMPEAYLESEELVREMLKYHPKWALQKRDMARLRKLRYDWIRSKGGFWSKVRTDTGAIAKQYESRDTQILEAARAQARAMREDVILSGKSIVGKKALAEIPGSWTTKEGEKVETDFWRVYGSTIWANELTRKSPFSDWMRCEIDVNLVLNYYAYEFLDFWAHEAEPSLIPRAWIRASMFALQSERKTTDGTPTDSSIAVHLPDVDLIVSADKNFVHMANRCHDEAPINIGKALLIQSGSEGIDQLFKYMSDSKKTKNL
jgi:hypothetical protein